jgi:phosphotriesterase-related protein
VIDKNHAVNTVLGTVAAQELGICLVHEHLLVDLKCLLEVPASPNRLFLVEAEVTPSLRGILSSDPYQCRDNLVLDNWQTAAQELGSFQTLGGRTVVDLSSRAIGPKPQELADIARSTSLNIIAPTGFYVGKAHPSWVEEATKESLCEFMAAEILDGIDGSKIKAGIIGELGVSSPILPVEKKVLEAAAIAQRLTGAAINTHLPIFGREGHNVLDILEQSGADLSRVALSHLDETMNFEYVRTLAERGAFIELDTFGSEFAFDDSDEREPTDWQRIDLTLRLLDAGFGKQILISQDVCTKIHLTKFGGYGYAHILRTIVPRLAKRGVDQRTMDLILIENPARLLAG